MVVKMATKDIAIQLKPLNIQFLGIVIEGISPLIQHKWAEKALREMREKHAGKKTKTRDIRDPEQEALDAMYTTADGQPGIPLLALKSAIIGAAHKDLGVEKTLVRKSLFIRANDESGILKIEGSKPKVREDYVRVGQGGTDLRYRPQFDEWRVSVCLEYDADLLQPTDIVNLINRAGFGIGLGEWRPEKGGEYGRFRVAV